MQQRKWIRDYLYFSRRDRLALALLILVTLVLYFSPHFLPPTDLSSKVEKAVVLAALDTLEERETERERERERNGISPSSNSSSNSTFPFDPNLLDSAGWIKLGLHPRKASSILKYRNKGGRFRKKEDLQKIYGLPKGFYERVAEYIRIEEESLRNSLSAEPSRTQTVPQTSFKQKSVIEINDADSAAFESLPGIGGKLAIRIMQFREKLGGFFSVNQVSEVYGLHDSVFRKLLPYLSCHSNVRKLNINKDDEEKLKMHPYIKWKGAALIMSYRKQHGAFKSIDELKLIPLFTEEIFQKLKAYIEL